MIGVPCSPDVRQMEFSRSILQGVEIKLCRNDAHAYKPHIHNELSLGYIMQGSTDLTLSRGVVHFNAGDGVLIPPLATHMCAPHDICHWAYAMLFVNPAYYGDAVHFRQPRKLTGGQTRDLIGFIDRLLNENNADALENTLIELLLAFGENGGEAPDDSGDAVEEIRSYILDHVDEEITLERLEKAFGLNRFFIIRNFKKQYVTTPAAYHLQCRVARAKEMLSGGVDVLDVCERLGFYDQAHFIRAFKRMYGVTPGRYVEQIRC